MVRRATAQRRRCCRPGRRLLELAEATPVEPAASNAAQGLPDVPRYEPFPLDGFPPGMRELAEMAARVTGFPVEYFAVPALGIVAGAIGRSRCLRVRRLWREPALLWLSVVAESGSGKCSALSLVAAPRVAAVARPGAPLFGLRLHP